MSQEWIQTYSSLGSFIAEHSEIEIGLDRVSIPERLRTEFFHLFDTVRTSFVESNFPDICDRSAILNHNYLKVEQDALQLMGLENVSIDDSLRRFINDPVNQLITGLFNPLFDLLQANVDIETFKEKASVNIKASIESLYLSGYKKWLALSLLKLLDANRLFQVTVPTIKNQYDVMRLRSNPVMPIPLPVESKRIGFLEPQNLRTLLIVPDFIAFSARLGRYFALRLKVGPAESDASGKNQSREWYKYNPVLYYESSMILVYVSDDINAISLVNDRKEICRPDMIIECATRKSWHQGGLDSAKLHHSILQPTLGTFILSEELISEESETEISAECFQKNTTLSKKPEVNGAGRKFLQVSFDQAKLAPMIDTLMSGGNVLGAAEDKNSLGDEIIQQV